jgi:hypothetical protein
MTQKNVRPPTNLRNGMSAATGLIDQTDTLAAAYSRDRGGLPGSILKGPYRASPLAVLRTIAIVGASDRLDEGGASCLLVYVAVVSALARDGG